MHAKSSPCKTLMLIFLLELLRPTWSQMEAMPMAYCCIFQQVIVKLSSDFFAMDFSIVVIIKLIIKQESNMSSLTV